MKQISEAEDQEREANQFAVELLMPEELLRKEAVVKKMKGAGVAQEDIDRLARRYGVSPTMMLLRLIDLGLAPMTLVL